MESNKQEKYDLLHDNPVAKDASGGRDVSWMSKHSKSRMGSPLHKEGGFENHEGTPPKYTDGLKPSEWEGHKKNTDHH